MKKKASFIVVMILFACSFSYAQSLALGEWATLLPYSNTSMVVDGGDKIYALGNIYPFSYEKSDGSIIRYDKVWGLSDVQATQIAYSAEADAFLICYENTNIDLIKDGVIINLADIERRSTGGNKKINSVYISGKLAYLASSLGIIVLDLENEEFLDTYVIGDNGDQLDVNSVTILGDTIYAATDLGVKKARLTGTILADFQNWQMEPSLPLGNADDIVSFGSRASVTIGDALYFLEPLGYWAKVYDNDAWNILHVEGSDSLLVISERDTAGTDVRLMTITPSLDTNYMFTPNLTLPIDVTIMDDGTLWVADEIRGLQQYADGSMVNTVIPNGPFSNRVENMSIRGDEIWVAPGGVNQDLGNVGNLDGFFKLEDGFWMNKNQFTDSELQGQFNLYSVFAEPGTNTTWFGTFWNGLIKYDGEDFTIFNQDNSPLAGQIGDSSRTKVGGLVKDPEGNIWVTNSGTNSPIHAIKPDGSWVSFAVPTGSIPVTDIVLDDAQNKWAILPVSSTYGILVLNYGANLDDPSDDRYKLLGLGSGNGGLTDANVRCIVKDNDGEIWVGTSKGINVFYCASSIFTDNSCDAQQILVERDGFAGYLLENEQVTAIAVDGANRKWVGTNNGLWVFSADGTEEEAYFTVDNSPLISNSITTISIQGKNGMVYIGTDKGLMAYRGEATAATNEHEDEILVYPNPVREDYMGPIAFKGLATNAEVKVTDANGVLIYQTTAYGGQAIWDGRDFNGRKAKTGVYLVFSSSTDGKDSKVGKFVLIK